MRNRSTGLPRCSYIGVCRINCEPVLKTNFFNVRSSIIWFLDCLTNVLDIIVSGFPNQCLATFMWVVYCTMLFATLLHCTSYNAIFSSNQTRLILQNWTVLAARTQRFLHNSTVHAELDRLWFGFLSAMAHHINQLNEKMYFKRNDENNIYMACVAKIRPPCRLSSSSWAG